MSAESRDSVARRNRPRVQARRPGFCPACGCASTRVERDTDVGEVVECTACGWNDYDERLAARITGQVEAYESWTEA